MTGAAQRAAGQDLLVRGVLAQGDFRFAAVRLTESVRECARLHALSGAAAQVLGEALLSTALVASPIKTDEKYSLSIQSQARLRSLQTDVSHKGDLRGYIRLADARDGAQSAAHLMAPPGVMMMTRSLPGRVTYQAITELRLGAIGADLALHLSTSDQIETEIRIYQSGEPLPESAGGLLVQAMPGADLDLFIGIRAALGAESALPPTALVENPADLVTTLLRDFSPRVLEISPIQLQCSCSRDRVETIFRQLPAPALLELTLPDGSAYALCHWCNARYLFSAEEMTALFRSRTPGGGLPQ
jgi:molecular chaperone Hsp33